ncbi:MAG: LysM peptidoglycan-binding domain-containing protein [Paracoccus sp. (in: a-proteobacteria)]|uniref:LysM peptidoglycan-binding domain-containing protein n=1 Tax=Paracoccus sp. TaxID=267 RepID=UPI0026DFCE3C|nr:LysM peptidoglycan-binding domain-containing protein [Paracoccus sp. (in: a-proteobacteria)]MDO5621583.1 LysM peptidoglycan-binding domain-containing protein [Paracoccus sp. (in: a-proteobacteria)]
MINKLRSGVASLMRPNLSTLPLKTLPQPPQPKNNSGTGSANTNSGSTTSGTSGKSPAGGSGSVEGAKDAAQGIVSGANIREGVEKLNSAGDTLSIRMTGEAKVQGSLKYGKVGIKGQMGGQTTITRNSDAPDSTYTLRYDAQSLLAATGETGTDALGRGKGGASGSPGVNVKAEIGGQIFDVVEMTFDNKEDAIRAGEALQRLQNADMVDDAMAMVAQNAIPFAGSTLYHAANGSGSNPIANPLHKDGTPGWLGKTAAGVTQEDMDFLQSHVTAYETTIGSRSRLAAEVKGDLKVLEGALEGRLDENRRITRRVELPTADKDGSVTYSVSGGLRLSAKERLNRKTGGFGGLTLKADNRLELGQANVTASLHYTLPKGSTPTTSVGGRPLPEADALSGNTPMTLDKITLQNNLEVRTQGFDDISRGDSGVLTETLTINDPGKLKDATEQLFAGDFKQAAETAGAQLDLELKTIERSGVDIQPGFKLDAAVADIEASVILATGVDDITSTRKVTIQPGTEGTPDKTETRLPPAPENDGKTYAVQPYVGAHIRTSPEGESLGVVQSGSFLRDEGSRQTDAQGQEWMQVSGTDSKDAPVSGWVRADLLQAHSSATGAMDGEGRINPTAEYNRMDRITVQQDDNLWNLAQEHGWDYQETLAANQDHLINPSLIFKGDTVYVPGSARGPEPEVVTIPGDPGTPSVQTESSGDTGSGVFGPSQSPSISGSDQTPPPVTSDTPPANTPTQPGDIPGRRDLNGILNDYQVRADDSTRNWQPSVVNPLTEGIVNGLDGLLDKLPGDFDMAKAQDAIRQLKRSDMPKTEADMLDRLNPVDQLRWALLTKNVMDEAPGAVDQPAGFAGSSAEWQNDGHVDAYRHALWNARMTQAFGAEWAANYATAHEMINGNPAQREAMDLYNNEVGRQIALDNPNASDAELSRLVKQALDDGRLVVIDQNLNLSWSDQVAVGAHGLVPEGSPQHEANPEMTPKLQNTGS